MFCWLSAYIFFFAETSIQQLKHLGETKKRELPTLEELCAFLDINARNIENNNTLQKYLVRRIRDLAQGGCMSQFFWDGGGSYQYRHWREDMVTDSEVINSLLLLCFFIDDVIFVPSWYCIYFASTWTVDYCSIRPVPKANLLVRNTSSHTMQPYNNNQNQTLTSNKSSPIHHNLVLYLKAKALKFQLVVIIFSTLFFCFFIILEWRILDFLGMLLIVLIQFLLTIVFCNSRRINLGPSGLNIAWVIDKWRIKLISKLYT